MEDFYTEKYLDQRADLIVCRHVLEHIPDPDAFIAQVRQAVGDKRSVVFFEVPNALWTLQRGGIWDVIYEHCSYSVSYTHLDVYKRQVLAGGPLALGAYDGEMWVGVAVGERRDWNRTLWLHEFHVAAGHHRQGIGRRLMDALAERARAAGLRALMLETQNTNVPAIRFYRRVGFTLDGLNVAYYTNDDLRPDLTVALFMTRRLE